MLKRVLKQRTDNGERHADMKRALGEYGFQPWHMKVNPLDQLVKGRSRNGCRQLSLMIATYRHREWRLEEYFGANCADDTLRKEKLEVSKDR